MKHSQAKRCEIAVITEADGKTYLVADGRETQPKDEDYIPIAGDYTMEYYKSGTPKFLDVRIILDEYEKIGVYEPHCTIIKKEEQNNG